MKATAIALMLPMSAVVVGFIVAFDASMVTLSIVQSGGIGADTPVSGITVGLIVVGGCAALIAAVKGATSLVLFTLSVGKWFEAVNGTVAQVETNTRDIATNTHDIVALQRWRDDIVGPLLKRSGIGKPNPVGERQRLYRDEAAGE